MVCHRCKNDIGLVKQVQEADTSYYQEDKVSAPIMLMLFCETCQAQTAMIDIVPLAELDFETVESPVGPVTIPKP